MEKALTKKSIMNLQKHAETMTDLDFKKQATSMLGALSNTIQKAMEDGRIASTHFYNGVNKEMEILSKMIESNEYSSVEKVAFSKRMAKLVDKLHKKDIIKDVTVWGTIGAFSLAIVSLIIHRK